MKIHAFFGALLVALVVLAGCGQTPPPASGSEKESLTLSGETAQATFAGGCFWCVEAAFEQYTGDGVISVVSGFTSGSAEDAVYQKVASGATEHYEAVQVTYDPKNITYQDLLEIFWRQIDPTDSEGSFVDRGKQYRSAIFYSNEKEKALAELSRNALVASGRIDGEVVTPIVPVQPFYPAEEYHQDYYKKDPVDYKRYRSGSGRDQYRERVWGSEKEYVVPRQLSEEQLRAMLTNEQYDVTQREGTETPFENEYNENKEAGIYVDVVSGEPLFSSLDKFDSGTGWPSFTKPIHEYALQTATDFKIGYPRTELRSAIADSHLGHVFDDGPDPTGLRYCINSAALRFIPVDKLEEEGYGHYVSSFH